MLHFFFFKKKKNNCRYHYQNLDDIIYSSWDIEQNIPKLVILGHLSPFYPSKKPQNQNFEKWKNLLEISSFYTCTKNHNHMMYGSWDMECDRQNFLSFWTVFCPFTPLTTPKIKILKNEKICWRYHHFTHAYQKSQSYDVRFLRYRGRQAEFFCHFGPFFALSVHWQPRKSKF